ncbi:MAG: hypothetical protein HY913_19275 [Desulfomonile tiedjei]|nr:hypothetical protein [Desulfomonile tiedjei]
MCNCCRMWGGVVFLLLSLVLATTAGAQTLPFSSGPGTSLFGDFGSWPSLPSLRAGDFKAGLFYGRGYIRVDHNIAAGPGQLDTQTEFDAFSHRRETRLEDTYVSLQWGLRAGDAEILVLNFETNIGRITQFKQTTSPGMGLGSAVTGGRATLATLFLPDNMEGVITLDNRSRVWNWDILGMVPVLPGVDFLVGYKYTRIASSLDPYSAAVPSDPANLFIFLPGLAGWQNNFGILTVSGAPSTDAFSMNQAFRYQGLLIGARLKNTVIGFPQVGAWHVDFLCAPYLLGGYEFTWDGIQTEPGGAFIKGSQTTNATGLKRYYLEVRGAAQFPLRNSLNVDVKAKWAYLSMKGSAPEIQFADTNVIASPSNTFLQSVGQTIHMSEYFWGIGGDLVLAF